MPGVESASLTSHLPIGDVGNTYRTNAQGQEGDAQRIFLRGVFPGSFETLGIPLQRGRTFAQRDGQPGADPVVVVNETLAIWDTSGLKPSSYLLRLWLSHNFGDSLAFLSTARLESGTAAYDNAAGGAAPRLDFRAPRQGTAAARRSARAWRPGRRERTSRSRPSRGRRW